MASIVGSLLQRIIKVRVEGNINQKLYFIPRYRTDSITDGFKKARFFTPSAVVVVVNSPGGSLAQAKHISDILKNYSARNKYFLY